MRSGIRGKILFALDKTLPGILFHKFVFDVPAAARDHGAYLVIIRLLEFGIPVMCAGL